MGLSFVPKAAPAPTAPQPAAQAPVQAAKPAAVAPQAAGPTLPPQVQHQAPPAKPKVSSWMAVGVEGQKMAEQEQAAYEERKAEMGKAFRFFLKDKEECLITFVDGDLTATPHGSFLLPPRFYEHGLKLNGKIHNYVCPAKSNPGSGETCPLCEAGDYPSLVAVFTVIDHRQGQSEKGTVYKDTRKLLVAKQQSFEMLSKFAMEIGGLAGSTWKVSRAGDKSPAIDNTYFPKGKQDLESLRKAYVEEVVDPKSGKKSVQTKFAPLDYESEIVYRTGDQLRAMGLSKPDTKVSGFGGTATSGLPQTGQDYSEHL